MNQVKVVIFDCDGVMFDSREANEAYYNQIVSYFKKKEISRDERDFVHMHTADESVRYLFRDDLEIENSAQAYRKKISYIQFIPHMKMEPYLIEILEYLRCAYKTAIATNRTDTMKHVLSSHGLEEHFDFVVSALDVQRPKPHPESLYKILNYFKITSKEALFIGDSELDQAASEAAGVPFVAYQNKRLSANYYIEHFKELEELLANP